MIAMKYTNICEGTFLERPNRFIAKVQINQREETAHVKNTGRCKELLIPGAHVYLEDFSGRMGDRKTRWSLISVEKGDMLINMDSQVPNHVAKEALESGKLCLPGMSGLAAVQSEKTFGASRLDFYVEDQNGAKGLMEVKGVTLEEEGVAKFPDAPTERGVRHIETLIRAAGEGYRSYILFVIAMKGVRLFMPNDRMHRAFGDALRKAEKAGVTVLAYDCKATANSLELGRPVELCLETCGNREQRL